MCPGQERSLAPLCSNLKSFVSKCTVLKKVLATFLGLFSAPQWFGCRGIVPPSVRGTPLFILLVIQRRQRDCRRESSVALFWDKSNTNQTTRLLPSENCHTGFSWEITMEYSKHTESNFRRKKIRKRLSLSNTDILFKYGSTIVSSDY